MHGDASTGVEEARINRRSAAGPSRGRANRDRLKILVLFNPLVYMTEALRTSITPELPHMAIWASVLALTGGSIALSLVSLRTFIRRVVN